MSRVAFLKTEDRNRGVKNSLRALGINPVKGKNVLIMKRRIFEQEQIARAVKLGLGASSPSDIDVVSVSPESQQYGERVVDVLMKD